MEKPAANDDDQQPSFDPVNDSLATDDMDLGGTGNVRIGSVDSPMLKKYKKERDARGNQEEEDEKGEKQRKAKRLREDRVAGVDVLRHGERFPHASRRFAAAIAKQVRNWGRQAKEYLCELRQ